MFKPSQRFTILFLISSPSGLFGSPEAKYFPRR